MLVIPFITPWMRSLPSWSQSIDIKASQMPCANCNVADPISGKHCNRPTISSPTSSIPICRISGKCSTIVVSRVWISSTVAEMISGRFSKMPCTTFIKSSIPPFNRVGAFAMINSRNVFRRSVAVRIQSGNFCAIPVMILLTIVIPLLRNSGNLAVIPSRTCLILSEPVCIRFPFSKPSPNF